LEEEIKKQDIATLEGIIDQIDELETLAEVEGWMK
jgi:hypothetical protein